MTTTHCNTYSQFYLTVLVAYILQNMDLNIYNNRCQVYFIYIYLSICPIDIYHNNSCEIGVDKLPKFLEVLRVCFCPKIYPHEDVPGVLSLCLV